MTNQGTPKARTASLRILGITDIHGALAAWDYYTDKPNDGLGLTRTASLIAAAREEGDASILLDCGDFLQGSALTDLWAEEPDRLDCGLHPVLESMVALGVDAGTLGNHDFNYGLAYLERVLAPSPLPIVCANVAQGALADDPLEDRLMRPAFTLVARRITLSDGTQEQLKIGVIGFCPRQIMTWDRRALHGRVDARPIVEAAQAWIPALRAAGADIVVALSHAGISPAPLSPEMEHVTAHLAAVPGIDAILAGHQHQVFPGTDHPPAKGIDPAAGTLHGVPTVMPGYNGAELGVIDLSLGHDGAGWSVLGGHSETRPIADTVSGRPIPRVSDDPALTATIDPAHRATLSYVRRPIGETRRPINTYFSLVADNPALDLVARAQSEFIKAALEDTEYASLPLLSVTAPFKAGGNFGPDYFTDIPPGPVALRDIADLYLYPNTACALMISGADMTLWLERSAGLFLQIEPGAVDAPLLNPTYFTYNFDVISGLTYRLDLSRPAAFDDDGAPVPGGGGRVVDLACGGQPVDPEARFVLATSNYRAGGGGGFAEASRCKVLYESDRSNRDILRDYVAAAGVLDLSPTPTWDFAPISRASAIYPCSPRSNAPFQDTPPARLTAVGPADSGFFNYRMSF